MLSSERKGCCCCCFCFCFCFFWCFCFCFCWCFWLVFLLLVLLLFWVFLFLNYFFVAPSGKLHVFVGSMDAYYLDSAVYLMENDLDRLQPPAGHDFRYGTSRGRGYSHAWKGSNEMSAEEGD